MNDAKKQPGDYRIPPPEAGSILPSLQYWQCRDIYVSDICIAVKLSPIRMENCEAARDELYRLLRGIWQTALLYNLVRPVAAVIYSGEGDETRPKPLSKTLAAQIRAWASDQNWHQGHFSLYVEPIRENAPQAENDQHPKEYPFGVDDILLDLLAPEPQEIGEIEQRDLTYIEKEMKSQPEDSPALTELNARIEEAWRSSDKYDKKTPGPFQAWLDEIPDPPASPRQADE